MSSSTGRYHLSDNRGIISTLDLEAFSNSEWKRRMEYFTGRMTSKGNQFMSEPKVNEVKLKTKAQMLERIKYLEDLIKTNYQGYEKTLTELKLSHQASVNNLLDGQNRRLLEILLSGSKEGAFPRRNA